MKILKYKCKGTGGDLNFSEIKLRNVNLLVGDSASGKTRLMNTIFNLFKFVRRDKYIPGFWDITFSIDGVQYRWILEATNGSADVPDQIAKETLSVIEHDIEEVIISRSHDEFIFMGNRLPKLSPRLTSLSLLKAEDSIKSIYEGFCSIRRRLFHKDALSKLSQLETISPDLLDGFEDDQNVGKLFGANLGLNVTLFILQNCFPDIFNRLTNYYKLIFPFVKECAVRDLSEVSGQKNTPMQSPIFCIREQRPMRWITLPEMSSGMQKVLLIISDVLIQPDGSIYMIDEYENSLGISAINFFPDFLLELETDIQILITSHHPWLINKMPVSSWCLFTRRGINVTISQGKELQSKFGKSKQQSFIQLINDPSYVGGVN